MKNKSNAFPSKVEFNVSPTSRSATASISLACSAAIAFLAVSASAATFQWNGSTSNWQTAANWSTVTTPPLNNSGTVPPFNTTGGHRLNVNGAQALEYTAAEGTTYYGTTTVRGLVIGSGTAGSGTMTILGGTFSTLNSDTQDAIGNVDNNTGILNINGGNFIGSASGTDLNLGVGTNRTSTLNVNSGTATIAGLRFRASNATVNLNGGDLAVNSMSELADTGNPGSTMNFNGGTLKARLSSTSFIAGLDNVRVKSGGAIIDTNTFNVTISNALLTDPVSLGGGLTKKSSGVLTLGAPSTITGAVTVEAGGLGVKTGAASWAPSSLTHSGDTLNFDLGVYLITNPPVIDVPALTLNTIGTTVNISGSGIPIASEIIILDYGTKSGTGSLTLGSLPVGVFATLHENTVAGYYYLDTTPPAGVLTWSGDSNPDATGAWDFSSLNWNSNAVAYAQPASVTFPDIIGGGTVTLTTDVAPNSCVISNATGNPYTFDGTGKITGLTGITMTGTGIATFNGAAHSYSGAVVINAGAIIKKAADATTGGITVAADNVSFVLDGGITDGTGQTLTMSGRGSTVANYFYSGSAAQRGALQAHNGANSWQGNIVVASTSVVNRIGVQNGASLTLTGNISESVAGASIMFRAGATGDDITLGGAGSYSYTGGTQMFSNGGAIILGADNKLPINSSLFFGFFGTPIFDLNGNDQEVAGITGDTGVTITNNGSGLSTLTTTSPAAVTNLYEGLITDGSDIVSLVKKGTGTQSLTGLNTYTGNTTIEDGTLSVSQSNFADASTVTIGTAAASPAALNLPNAEIDIVTLLVIDGVMQPGGGLVYDSTNSGGAITGLGKIQVGAGGYTSWASGGEPFDGDANGDGVQDGLAWFLGAATPATNALDKLPKPAKEGAFLTLDFKRLNPYSPAKLYVEIGNSLSGWTVAEIPAATGMIDLPGDDIVVEVTGNSLEDVKVKIPTSYQSTSGALFARLRATNN